MFENIRIRGATQHNLKNIDVTIPRNRLVVITGLSGSGKSSLAFDTLYAEGQRRYVESLSAYARQFLDRLQKPKVEHIEGLSPAIAIEQRTAGGTPRSTVATVTEIYDYLRLLYAHVGTPHCPHCGRVLESQSAQAIAEQLMRLRPGQKMMILAPFVSGRKGEHRDVLDTIRSEGFVRARIDGRIVLLDEETPKLEKTRRHTIEAVVDRLMTGKLDPSRLTDSVETALRHGSGVLTVLLEAPEGETPEFSEEKFSENLLDATNAFALDIEDVSELDGIPSDVVDMYAASAKAAGLEGKWRISLHMPSYLPAMQYANNAALREKLHRAYSTRASEYGPAERDNTPLIR